MAAATCAKADCDELILARGLCLVHYHRQYRKERKGKVSPRSRALSRLADEFPDRFRELLDEEVAR